MSSIFYSSHTETSLVLHFGKIFSIKLVITSSSAGSQAQDNLHQTCICSKKFMIKLIAKSKKIFEGDIIRHLLWGRGEINIEFLDLGQPLRVAPSIDQILVTYLCHCINGKNCRFT